MPHIHDVFISHASPDKPIADAACHALEAAGIRVWMAPRDVVPGTPYGKAILQAIENCRLMVVVFSNQSNCSEHVAREIELAARAQRPLLPMRITPVQPNEELMYFLGRSHWLDAVTPPIEAHLCQLVGAVETILGRTASGNSKPDATPQLVRSTSAPSGVPTPPAAVPLTTPPTQSRWKGAAKRLFVLFLSVVGLIACALLGAAVLTQTCQSSAPPPTDSPQQARSNSRLPKEYSASEAPSPGATDASVTQKGTPSSGIPVSPTTGIQASSTNSAKALLEEADALCAQAFAGTSEDRASLLMRAASKYQEAKTAAPIEIDRVRWFHASNNRARALVGLSSLQNGAEAARTSAEAIDLARYVSQQVNDLDDWRLRAQVYDTLGSVLLASPALESGDQTKVLTDEAIAAFRAAFAAYPAGDVSLSRAETAYRLGTLLAEQEGIPPGRIDHALCAETVTALKAGAAVVSEQQSKARWVELQVNLARALAGLGAKPEEPNRCELMREAIARAKAAATRTNELASDGKSTYTGVDSTRPGWILRVAMATFVGLGCGSESEAQATNPFK